MKGAASARTAAPPTSSPPASRSRPAIEQGRRPVPAAPPAAPAEPATPTREQVRALAYAALLDHARRSDHAHALATLVRALASLIGAECWLWPQPPDGSLSMPPIHARPPVLAPISLAEPLVQTAWVCSHSGTIVGELRTPLPSGLALEEWG